MSSTLQTLRFNTQAQLDVARITRDLTDLQRQVASGFKSNELAGYGVGASRLLNTRGLVELTTARAGAAAQFISRFGVQASALNQVATSTFNLAQSIRDALSNDNSDALPTELTVAFAGIVSGLNETWNGQPLFAGERTDTIPVQVASLDALVTTPTSAIFDEADRPQLLDLGPGAQIALAERASELSSGLFDALRALKSLVDTWGGTPPDNLTTADRDALTDIAQDLDRARDVLGAAEARAGQLEQRITDERSRLTTRANLLQKEIGEQTDADPAQLSIQISSLLAQYQATAKTFADISGLTLLNYLR